MCHVAKATKEGSSRNLTQDLGTKSGVAPKKKKKKEDVGIVSLPN